METKIDDKTDKIFRDKSDKNFQLMIDLSECEVKEELKISLPKKDIFENACAHKCFDTFENIKNKIGNKIKNVEWYNNHEYELYCNLNDKIEIRTSKQLLYFINVANKIKQTPIKLCLKKTVMFIFDFFCKRKC